MVPPPTPTPLGTTSTSLYSHHHPYYTLHTRYWFTNNTAPRDIYQSLVTYYFLVNEYTLPYFQFSISSRCLLQLGPFVKLVREVGLDSMRPPPLQSSSCSPLLRQEVEEEGSRGSTTTKGSPPSHSQTYMEGHTHISSSTTTQVSFG